MTYMISDQATLRAILDAAHNEQWQRAYNLVIQALSNPSFPGGPAPGVDLPVYLWLEGAVKINRDDGAFAHYIRTFTARQYEIRNGSLPPDWETREQAISDKIIENFVKTLMGVDLLADPNARLSDVPPAAAVVPTIHQVGLVDGGAGAAMGFADASTTGLSNYSPWAGTSLFVKLGDPSFFEDCLLTLGRNQYKQETGTYDLISHAQVTLELKNLGFVAHTLLSGEFDIYLQLIPIGTDDSIRMSAKAQAFFEKAYGDDVWAIRIGDSILNDFVGGLEATLGSRAYRIGTIHDDAGKKALKLDPRNIVVHAGAGDDEFVAPTGWGSVGGRLLGPTVLDGGDDLDSIDYSALIGGVRLAFDDEGAFGWRAVAHRLSGIGPRDAIYNVETFVLTDRNDVIVRDDALKVSDLEINLRGGSNHIEFKHVRDGGLSYEGGSTKYLFETGGDRFCGPQVQTISVDSALDHAILQKSSIFVDGVQLLGGSAVADTACRIASGWSLWRPSIETRFIGAHGEDYIVTTSANGRCQMLEIVLDRTNGASDYKIQIANWQQGDFGIELPGTAAPQDDWLLV
ncbi:hypothetical protein [Inquilinus limosus]